MKRVFYTKCPVCQSDGKVIEPTSFIQRKGLHPILFRFTTVLCICRDCNISYTTSYLKYLLSAFSNNAQQENGGVQIDQELSEYIMREENFEIIPAKFDRKAVELPTLQEQVERVDRDLDSKDPSLFTLRFDCKKWGLHFELSLGKSYSDQAGSEPREL